MTKFVVTTLDIMWAHLPQHCSIEKVDFSNLPSRHSELLNEQNKTSNLVVIMEDETTAEFWEGKLQLTNPIDYKSSMPAPHSELGLGDEIYCLTKLRSGRCEYSVGIVRKMKAS